MLVILKSFKRVVITQLNLYGLLNRSYIGCNDNYEEINRG